MNPRVINVIPTENYKLILTFSNKEVREFDVAPYFNTGLFAGLIDKTVFNSVKPFLGSIQWSNGLDFCPDTLYLESKTFPDSESARTI